MGIGVTQCVNDIAAEDDVLAEVGTKLFGMVAEDMIESGEVEGVTPEIITQAAGQAIEMWAARNPERFNSDEFAQLWQQEVQGADIEGVGATDPATQAAPQGGLLSEGM